MGNEKSSPQAHNEVEDGVESIESTVDIISNPAEKAENEGKKSPNQNWNDQLIINNEGNEYRPGQDDIILDDADKFDIETHANTRRRLPLDLENSNESATDQEEQVIEFEIKEDQYVYVKPVIQKPRINIFDDKYAFSGIVDEKMNKSIAEKDSKAQIEELMIQIAECKYLRGTEEYKKSIKGGTIGGTLNELKNFVSVLQA